MELEKPKILPVAKGLTPNTAQRRPEGEKHSPPKPFSIKGTSNGA